MMSDILCMDTDPETRETLRRAGHRVTPVEFGYQTGKRYCQYAPQDFDLIVCDLRRPACYDVEHWGPYRGNDNFKCNIIPQDQLNWKQRTIRRTSTQAIEREYRHRLISETQIAGMAAVPSPFGPKDILRAISLGGIPAIIFLNPEWVLRTDGHDFPMFFGLQWETNQTNATKFEILDPLKTLIRGWTPTLTILTPIRCSIRTGPTFPPNTPLGSVSVENTTIISDRIGSTLGQFTRCGKGSIWLLPSTADNAIAARILADHLQQLSQFPSPSLADVQLPPVDEECDGTISCLTNAMADFPIDKTTTAHKRPMAAISYAHGPRDNEVIELADRINLEGIDCELDVYENAPPEGWARWMERMMRQRVVLVIVSEAYYRRHCREEATGIGLGATFESGLLAQRVLEMQGANEGIIPVLLASEDARYIPEFLRDVTRYDLSDANGYERLYRRLTRQPEYLKPPVGELRVLPPKNQRIAAKTAFAQRPATSNAYNSEISETLQDAAGPGGLLIPSYICAMSLIIHPSEYADDRFSEEQERSIIESARHKAGLAFPISKAENTANLEDGFQGTTIPMHDGSWSEFREYYRFRRDGLFVLTRVSPDDIGDDQQYRNQNRLIGFNTLLTTATEMMTFAAALAYEYSVETTALIRISGLANHRLTDDLMNQPLMIGMLRAAHQDIIATEFKGSPEEFQKQKYEWAVEAIVRCLRALNYPAVPEEAKRIVREVQKRIG